MRIEELRVTAPRIPFKVSFRHASAERAETSSLWIEAVSDGGQIGYGESCPRPYVTGETIETAREFVARHEAAVRDAVSDVDSLRRWVRAHETDIDANPAAWCALELACLDLIGKHAGVPVEALLALSPLGGRFEYTAVLGDMSTPAFAAMAAQYAAMGFRDFKIKLSGDPVRDADKMATLEMAAAEPVRIRVDANNLWADANEAIAFLRGLDTALFAVEEPIAPPNQYAVLSSIGDALGCRIVLDESFLRLEQLEHLRSQPDGWLINVRVSKMGGLLRSLAIVNAARDAGIAVVVGAQVGETSLLTRAALTVAHAAGGALAAQEGAFGTLLLERDVCERPLMFGRAGVLDLANYPEVATGPGFGLGVLAHV